MSLFQCGECGCVENTALASQGFRPPHDRYFDWTGKEKLQGKLLCCVCGPTKYRDGTPTKFGKWHNCFKRTFLPIGKFRTNSVGNLEHVDTGETDYSAYKIEK